MDELMFIGAIENIEFSEMLSGVPRLSLRKDPFTALNDRAFIQVFRLSKELTQYLIDLLDNVLRQPTRISALTTQTKVLITLAFFASGSYQTMVGYNLFCGFSQSTVSNSITEVVAALNQPEIFNKWVAFPRNIQEMSAIHDRFYTLYGISGIIGIIDCSHVAIVAPQEHDRLYPGHIYINRKKYHSINVQLICDSTLKILNVNARFPGSTHDAYIWSRSQVEVALRTVTQNRGPEFYLIGDSGYPLREWLQTPVRNPEPGTAEFRYNAAFLTARSTIERCNGLLKARFRCLLRHRVLHYLPSKASLIVNACIVLHNMCIYFNVPDPTFLILVSLMTMLSLMMHKAIIKN